MPLRAYFKTSEFDNAVFLGVCNTVDDEVFNKKIDKLCEAMDWDRSSVESIPCYSGAIVDRFPSP